MSMKKNLNVRCSDCGNVFDFYSCSIPYAEYRRSTRTFLCNECGMRQGRKRYGYHGGNYSAHFLISKEIICAPNTIRLYSIMFGVVGLALLAVAALIYLGYLQPAEFPFVGFGLFMTIGGAVVFFLNNSCKKVFEKDFGIVADFESTR